MVSGRHVSFGLEGLGAGAGAGMPAIPGVYVVAASHTSTVSLPDRESSSTNFNRVRNLSMDSNKHRHRLLRNLIRLLSAL